MTLRFGSIHHPDYPLTTGRLSMTNPAKNRLHDYEAGWLTLLVEMGVATKEQAHEAMCRVAQAAIDEMEARRQKRRAARNSRRKREQE
jgi:hypothetical protein